MIIDSDVLSVAKSFGLDPQLLQAVVIAEGNILKAVQCSLPNTQTRSEALTITARSAVHALCDWVKADPDRRVSFVEFWGDRWAPQGASNDPTNLNSNWPTNVEKLWSA